jgi:hypothetical protein
MAHTPGKEIPGCPGYTATHDGRIYSVAHNWRGYGIREIKQVPNYYGYPSVRISIDGRRKHYPVHKLVALTFLGECPPDATEIRHLDGDKTNNHIDNLTWGNASANASDRERHGHTSRGKSHSLAIIRGMAKRGIFLEGPALERWKEKWA